MKIRKSCVPASGVVSSLSKKYELNPVWVWEIIEDLFNIIKGTGGQMVQAEIDELEQCIINEKYGIG